jgi:hypothetical protein
MKSGILILAGALLLAPATPLAAQTITSHPASERGEHSLALSLNGTSQIGYWTRQSDRTDLGFEVGANGLFSDSNSHVSLTVTPAIKRYHSSAGPLAPYTYIGIPLYYTRSTADNVDFPDTKFNSYGLGGIVGIGLDWFPLQHVSIGGHAGLRANFFDQTDGDAAFSIGTFTSGIRAQLYF